MNAHAETAIPRRIVYRHVDGRTLGAYVYSPGIGRLTAPPPAVLMFHGGGWVVGEPAWVDDAARKFAALGLAAISIEYRLANGDATPADSLDDACASLVWIREQADALDIDAQRVAGYGVSAGAQLLTMASMRCKTGAPKALLLVSPALEITGNGYFAELLRGHGDAESYSPISHIDDDTPPTLIIQGDKDSVTPTAAARRFCATMHEHRRHCELAVYENLGHVLTRNLHDELAGLDTDETALFDSETRMQRFLQTHGIIPVSNPTDPK